MLSAIFISLHCFLSSYLPVAVLFIIISHVVEVDEWAIVIKIGRLMGVVVLGYVDFFSFKASAQTLKYLNWFTDPSLQQLKSEGFLTCLWVARKLMYDYWSMYDQTMWLFKDLFKDFIHLATVTLFISTSVLFLYYVLCISISMYFILILSPLWSSLLLLVSWWQLFSKHSTGFHRMKFKKMDVTSRHLRAYMLPFPMR